MQEAMARRAQQNRANADARLDQAARGAGYRSLADLLYRTRNRRLRDIAALLGISDRYAGELQRRRFPREGRRRATRDPATDTAGYQRRSQAIRTKHRALWDLKAQQAGYTDMPAALTATATLGPTQQAKLLGVSKTMIYYIARELNNASH
jgi:hypothetical protein